MQNFQNWKQAKYSKCACDYYPDSSVISERLWFSHAQGALHSKNGVFKIALPTLKRYDIGRDGYLDLTELKYMMEKLGAPQTHLGLKQMIQEVDEDNDGKISFREFLLIYRKAQAGELENESGLKQLARLTEINVEEVGVSGAKNFFEAKIEQQLRTNKFHDEIRQEQEERRRQEEEKANRRLLFQQRAAIFQ
uniref:EF-hand domain-containing protein n=1 Tax=Glossina pallidipes TaxID=7398 RepID=A0A1A9ZDA7_GLOPL